MFYQRNLSLLVTVIKNRLNGAPTPLALSGNKQNIKQIRSASQEMYPRCTVSIRYREEEKTQINQQLTTYNDKMLC